MKKLILLILIVLPFFSEAQDTIRLKNPSFEDKPRCCMAPARWNSCGIEDSNTPDVQPGTFGVRLKPIDGDSYLGMVTRSIETWEAVTQKLTSPLQSNNFYSFSIAIASSKQLFSQDRLTFKDAFYDTPITLRIWGGEKNCHKGELLGVSPPIDHNFWVEYSFTFAPTENWDHIRF